MTFLIVKEDILMETKMSLQARQELLNIVRKRYRQATWSEKNKILNELVSTIGSANYMACCESNLL